VPRALSCSTERSIALLVALRVQSEGRVHAHQAPQERLVRGRERVSGASLDEEPERGAVGLERSPSDLFKGASNQAVEGHLAHTDASVDHVLPAVGYRQCFLSFSGPLAVRHGYDREHLGAVSERLTRAVLQDMRRPGPQLRQPRRSGFFG